MEHGHGHDHDGIARKDRSWLRIALPVGILAAGFVIVALLIVNRPTPESRPPEIPLPTVHVTTAHSTPIHFTVRAYGTVTPRTESDLIPQVSGPVVWVSPALASGGFFEAVSRYGWRIDAVDS